MQQIQTSCRVEALDHLVLTVADLQATLDFYTSVLGMQARAFTAADGTERHALYFGTQKINLHEAGHEFDPKAKAPTSGSADLCFLTAIPLDIWGKHLAAQGIAIEDGPVPRSGATGPIESLYFRDPDGNLIEVSVAAA